MRSILDKVGFAVGLPLAVLGFVLFVAALMMFDCIRAVVRRFYPTTHRPC